jgi:hypothetical protein
VGGGGCVAQARPGQASSMQPRAPWRRLAACLACMQLALTSMHAAAAAGLAACLLLLPGSVGVWLRMPEEALGASQVAGAGLLWHVCGLGHRAGPVAPHDHRPLLALRLLHLWHHGHHVVPHLAAQGRQHADRWGSRMWGGGGWAALCAAAALGAKAKRHAGGAGLVDQQADVRPSPMSHAAQ